MIQLLLVDDHKIVRDGLKSVFAAYGQEIHIAGEAASGQEALDFLARQRVDVVVMDVNMPGMNGLLATAHIRQHFPQVKVLLLTMLDQEQVVLEAVQVGAQGYVLKTAGHKEILHAIRMLSEGEEYFSTQLTKMLIRLLQAPSGPQTQPAPSGPAAAQAPPEAALAAGITPRELEVLELIAQGYTTNEIAERLFNSKRTIETHRQNLLTKTSTSNTAALIRFAVQQGLVE